MIIKIHLQSMVLEIYLQYFTKNGEVIDKNVGMTTVEKTNRVYREEHK
jgi:hypothetical protein